jgi:Fe-S-cluster containining protein
MSVSELFHHERLFVGCLALRRIKLHVAGDFVIVNNAQYQLKEEDAQQLYDSYAAQLFKMDSSSPYYVSIMTQAMDYEARNRCPALNDDHGCSIHDDRKPAVCSMVPFDSLYPDSLQNIVLLSRRFEENCIVSGQSDDYPLVFSNRQVSDAAFRSVLKKRRDELKVEKQIWGDAVFHTVQKELLSHPAHAAKIPADDSALLLSIIPVLQVLASLSESLRLRCLRYIDSQIGLLDDKIAQAIARKSAADKQTTHSFRSFKEHYLILRHQLASLTLGEPLTAFEIDQQEPIQRYLNTLGT